MANWFSAQSVVPVGGVNFQGTLLASAARTVTVDTDDQRNPGARGVMVTLDVTAVVDTPSIVLKVQHKDPASAKYETLLSATAVTATGTHTYIVHTDVGTAAGDITAVANYPLGQTWRVRVEHADTDSITYSVGYCLVP